MRLADSIIDELDEAYGLTLDREWSRVHDGVDSAVFRCGEIVVRVGPTWRTDAELAWTNEVALAAGDVVEEVVAPLVRPDGTTVVRIDDRPVTLWPFADGAPGESSVEPEAAAEVLARLHRALAVQPWQPRPDGGRASMAPTDLVDRDLDTWLSIFERDHVERIALHGDFTPANVLGVSGRVAAVLDWDDAVVGPPERELAWAAWEWGGGMPEALAFVDAYRAAGGPARRVREHDLRQLVREHVRLLAARGGLSEARLRAFSDLRLPSSS